MSLTSACFRLGFLLLVGAALAVAEPPRVEPPAGMPATVDRARQYDLTSRINGRTYRVWVSTPFGARPGRRYPVLYVLDGNWYFAPASVNATESSGAGEISPAIVVGVGYPTDDNDLVGSRRAFELTPWSPADAPAGRHGGGDVFLRVLEEEIRPFVAAHYAIDPARQLLYGKSFGGLLVLRSLLTNPGAYSTYLVASPALWFDSRAILRDVPAFAEKLRAGNFHLRLLITAAGDEQYRGPDPVRRAAADRDRQVDGALELADQLGALAPDKLQVGRVVIPDESHVSVSLASLGRALYFGLGKRE